MTWIVDRLRGSGRLRLDRHAIGNVEYEIVVKKEESGVVTADGTMRTEERVVRQVERAPGGEFMLELAGKSVMVELAIGETTQNTIRFDVITRVREFWPSASS